MIHIGQQLQTILTCGTPEIITISKSGTYQFKLLDNTDIDNSITESLNIKTTNSAKENVNISANKINSVINEYDYSSNNWIEGTATLDSSQYIWVPRLTYKLNDDNTTYTVKYLKGTTNIATDNTNMDTTYIIPPVFAKTNGTKLTGIWLKTESITINSETALIDNIKDLTPQDTNIITIE